MPIYKVNGDIYDIPASKQDAFEKRYPEATVSYLQGSDEYAIPIAKRDAFLAKYPNAKPKSYSEITDTTTHSMNLDPLSVDTQKEITPIRGYWANVKEGFKELGAHAKYLAGEGVNIITGSNRDELATLNEVSNIEAQGGNPTDVFAQKENQEFLDNFGMDKESFFALDEKERRELIKEATSRNAEVIMPDEVDNVTEAYKKEARIREQYLSAIKEAEGNLEKAKQILAKKAAEEKSIGDRMIEGAEEDLAEIRPSEGFAGYVGRLTTQMIPNAAAITLAALSKGKSAKASTWLMGLSKATGTLGMTALTASSGGAALKEAREKGATNAEAAAATFTAMGIEAITEMIPYDTYTKGIFSSIKNKVRKDLQREVLEGASSAGRKEFQRLLEEANKKLNGKLFGGKSIATWLGQTATEGVSEFLAEGLGVMVPMIYEDPENYPTLSKILESGWEGAKAGLLMGAFLGGASQATFHSLNKDRRKQQGFVNVAQVDFGDGDVDVAEILGKNEQNGKYVVLRGNETEEVNRDQILLNKHFTYNEFESARYKQLADEAIDNGNVSDAQVAVAADKVGNARQRLENAMTAAGYTDEQKDAAFKTLENNAYPEAYENIPEEVTKAMDNYMDAVSREKSIWSAKAEREQKEKDAVQTSLENELGSRFWREEVTPITEEVEEVRQTVETGQLSDGRLVYILSTPSATGEMSAVTEKGEQMIITADMLVNVTQQMSLDEFLASKVKEQKQSNEQARMAAEATPQLDEIRAKAQPGVQVNLGTEDSPIVGTILQIKPEGDGVLIQTESGVEPYTYEQLGDIFGTPVRTLTDAQMVAAEAAEIEAAEAALETERAETSEQMDEAEQVVDNAVQMEQVATDTPLPTNPDGSVNEDALFAEDPARWAEWNNSERNDNGENSKAYIQGKIDRANVKIAELKKAYENEDSLNKKKELEKQIAAQQETVDKLASVMQRYAPQEDSILALDEEVKAKMTAEKMQMIQQRAAEWERRLGIKVNILTSLDEVESKSAREEILQSDEIRKKGGYARTRGWFDKDSGQVYLYAPHIALLRPTAIEEDVDTTIFHEAVGHKGVRELLGEEKFNELLDRVWKEEMSQEDRIKYLVYTGGKGGTRAAADEFLAHRSEGMQYDSLWERIANWFKEKLNIRTNLSTASVKNILRESYKNFAENGSTATYKGGTGDNIAKSVVNEEISALSQDLTMEEIKAVTANDLAIAKEAYEALVANAPSVQPGETSVAYIERKKKYNEQLNEAKVDLDKKQAIVDEIERLEFATTTEEDNGVNEWFTNIKLSDSLDQNNSPFILSPNGNIDFGEITAEHNLPEAPIRLAMGDAQNGYIHINKRHGKEIQKEGFNSIEEFVKYVVDNFTRIQEGGAYANEKGGLNQTYLIQLQDKHNNTLFIKLSRDGKYWNVNSAGVFKKNYGNNKKNIWSASEVQNDNSAIVDSGLQSEPNADGGSTSNGTPPNVSESKDNEIIESATESSKKDAVEALNENGFEVNAKTDDIMLSRRYLPTEEQRELIISSVEKVTGLSREQAEKWLASETSLAAIVADDSQYLDYIPDDRYKAIKDNSDYPQGTVDFNNICRKRVSFTKMFTRLQRRFPNRIFTADDLADIRTIMSNDGLTVACGLCYVEDRRQMVGEVAAFFIDQMQKDFVDYTYEVSAKDFVAGKAKRKKSQSKDKVNKAAKYKILIGSDTYVPKIYDLTTLEGLDKLYNEHRGIWEAFQAFNSDRGQQSQNLFQGYAEYKREILSWSDAKVKKVNSLGGLRVFSYSDFEAHHLLDLVQIIIDCAARGVMIQGYTKVPEFARAVAKTGIKLNRSLIPLGDTGIVDGQLAFDPVEGIDVNDPNFLESNDNVGNILIGINDEQIRLAMASPFVHYIIPYHARQAENIRMKLKVGKWDNYIDTQNERNVSDGKRVKKGINIYTDVLSEVITNDREFVEKYLEVCREKGYIPKFDQFLNKDAEGNYIYTPGYHKFLVDFKLFDESGNILPQKPVVAQFDDEFNAEILQNYVADEKETTGAQMNETYKKIVEALNLNEEEAEGENIMFSTSNRNQAIFVSNAAKAVEGIKQEKATPEQWLKMIEKNGGLKAGEDKWMGLSDWLKESDKKTLTKQEVLDFVNEHMIVIEEQHYSNEEMGKASVKILNEKYQGWEDAFSFEWDGYMEEPSADISDYEAAVELYNKHHDEKVALDGDGEFENMDDYEKVRQFGVELSEIYHGSKSEVRPIDGTREQYTTQGLQHLHEIALTVPTIESWNESDDIHFGDAGEGRAVAWIRFGDASKWVPEQREDGKKGHTKKVLVIDEIQSKRHQEGREKGYTTKEDVAQRKAARARAKKATNDLYDYIGELVAKYPGTEYSLERVRENRGRFTEEENNKLTLLIMEHNYAELELEKHRGEGVPDAPFDKNWHELAMKRMLRYAAENGYDVVAWTKGEQQAERYILGKIYNEIEREDNRNIEGRTFSFSGGNYDKVTVNEDGVVVDSTIEEAKGKPLSDLVGKDLAVKMMSLGNYDTIDGEDLRIGGEGMKGFYDKMLPAFMNKYGKKWGIKVEDIELPNLEEAGRIMHSVPVTDEMKESVMEGQLMFSTKGVDESAKDFIQNATDAFYSRYNTVAPAAVVYANSRKMVAEGLGIDVDDLTDEVYKFIREKAKRSGGLFLPMQFTKEDGTVEERYRILIFAKDTVNMTAKADRILFHENTHGLISEMPELLDLGQWLLGSDERITSGIAADVKAQHDEDDWAEEMACDYVGVMLSLGRGQEALNNVADEYKPLLNSVYERFGYNPEDEDPRRRSERNKDARELQMRNTESEANSNQREEKLFSTVITPEVRREMDVISAQAIVNGNYLKAPNGKDTKLTPEQWSLVRTQNFKNWFGDWENDPENASKVVDENGEPMVVYHGTAGVINTFEDQQRSPGFWFVDREDVANGYAESAAGEFGEEKNIIPVFLNIRKPRVEDAHSEYPTEFALKSYVENDNGVYEVFDTYEEAEAYRQANVPDGWVGAAEVGDQHDLVERAKELGHDGVIMLNMHDQATYAETRVEGTQTNYVVLDANQIKSATENNGEFSEREDIRFSTVSTPTEVVVDNGLALSPKDVTNLAANIFKALPENVRKEIVDRASQGDWDLQKATLEFVNNMAMAYNLSDEHIEAVLAIAQKVEDAVVASGETLSRPLTTNEALWMLYNALNPANESDPFAMAERYVVADNLGFSERAKAEDDRLESEIMFSTTRRASDNARANLYNRGAASAMSRLKESFVDMYASVEELVKAIEVATGKPAKGFENILKALNQQSSKGLAAMEDYESKFLEPMFEQIVRIMKQANVSYDDVVRYVILKHGLERNDKFAKRDAREYWQSVFGRVAEKMKSQSHASLVVELSEAKAKVTAIETEMAVATGAKLRKLQDQLDAARLEVTVVELALRNNEQQNEQDLNAHLDDIEAGVDAKYKEFREKDYSGISSMFYDTLDVNRENYTTEEAYQAAVIRAKQNKWDTLAEVEGEAMHEVEMFERNAETKKLWKAINAATKETLRQQYEANVISKEQYDSLKNMFEFYVPLRGFKDNTAEDMYTYYRKPNSTGYTKPILGAEGRTTEAESPFGWIAAMASSAIASNVKNEAKLALYYFVVNRPENGIATVSKTWYVKTIENGKAVYKPSYPPFDADLSIEEAKEAYEQWQEDMIKLREQGLAYESGAKLNLGDSVVNISDVNKPEHVVTVKVGGKDYTIIINGNPRAAQAINGELNLETAGDYSKVFGPVLRWMSSVNTSYNPEFWITNTMRDMLFTWMSVSTNNDPEYKEAFRRNYRKAFKVLSFNKQYENGTLGDTYLETMYKEFIKNGGVTGYTQIKDNATWEKEIKTYLKSKDKEMQGKGKAMQKIKKGLHAVHRIGESLEQVSRFAAFLASREVGMSTIDSVNNAKEITVNFNRKGSGKWISLEEAKHLTKKNGQPLSWFEQICVSGLSSIAPLGRRAIMFFNASIQGLNAYYKLFKNNPAKMTTWALGYAIIGILNAALHSLLDDDDDYMDMPQYERRTSLLLGGGGVYFKWALPQEARAFYALGDLAVEGIMGRNPSEGVLDVIGEAFNIVLDMAPLNPTEGWKAFVPSVAVPLVELVANEDYKGDTIYNEQPWLSKEEKKRTPKYTAAYKGTSKFYVYLSKALNDISDSWDVDEAGFINVAPESIEHIVESAFGGTIRTAEKGLKTVWNMFDPEEDMTMRNAPFLNRVVTINNERVRNAHTSQVFKDCLGTIDEIDTRLKRYEKEGNFESANELKRTEEYQWLKIYENQYKKRLADLQKKIKVARNEAERRELMKKQDQLRKDFVKKISNR